VVNLHRGHRCSHRHNLQDSLLGHHHHSPAISPLINH
jgi:hypothetical protein